MPHAVFAIIFYYKLFRATELARSRSPPGLKDAYLCGSNEDTMPDPLRLGPDATHPLRAIPGPSRLMRIKRLLSCSQVESTQPPLKGSFTIDMNINYRRPPTIIRPAIRVLGVLPVVWLP